MAEDNSRVDHARLSGPLRGGICSPERTAMTEPRCATSLQYGNCIEDEECEPENQEQERRDCRRERHSSDSYDPPGSALGNVKTLLLQYVRQMEPGGLIVEPLRAVDINVSGPGDLRPQGSAAGSPEEMRISGFLWNVEDSNSSPCDCLLESKNRLRASVFPPHTLRGGRDRTKSGVFLGYKKGEPRESPL